MLIIVVVVKVFSLEVVEDMVVEKIMVNNRFINLMGK